MAHQQGYNYVQLAEAAEAPGSVHNVYAVVTECSVPRPTRGTDMVCNLTLVDPSTAERPDLAAGVEMLCFAAHAEELPQPRGPLDIIRLHRVKVNIYNNKPQLVGKVGFRGAGFAFCLFPAAPPPPGGPPCRPYQHSGQGYHMDGREEAVLGALRAYLAASQGRPQLGGAPTQYLRRIKDVRPRQFFDVLARVVAADDSNPHLRLLYIWDGSDVLPFPAAYDTRDGEDMPGGQHLLPLLRPFALPLEHMPDRGSVPLVGTALPVLFPKSARVAQPPPGAWVKLRNLGARVVGGQLQAYFHRNSRWTPWQGDAEQAEVEREYRARLAENHTAGWAPDARRARRELLALSRHSDRPVSSVRQVLLDAAAGQPRCYRLLVRLLSFEPAEAADMCHPARACGLTDAEEGRWVYTLKLIVEDATGLLDVILFDAGGDAFFPDLPPRDMAADPAAAAELHRRLMLMLGQGSQRDGGPWMELSVKSYFSDASRPWQTRHYRVFDAAWQEPDAQQERGQQLQQHEQRQQAAAAPAGPG